MAETTNVDQQILDIRDSTEGSTPFVDTGPYIGDIVAKKTSVAYRAHSYHTKVPPEGIQKLIEHYTAPGERVVDPFCGSGMTGVAAMATGRHATLSDLSPAACHIAEKATRQAHRPK